MGLLEERGNLIIHLGKVRNKLGGKEDLLSLASLSASFLLSLQVEDVWDLFGGSGHVASNSPTHLSGELPTPECCGGAARPCRWHICRKPQ